MKQGDTYETKYGTLEILEYINAQKVKCKFLKTNFVTFARRIQILNDRVKDPLFPTVYGKGYLGIGDYNSVNSTNAHACWSGMIGRCYSDDLHKKYPTYKNCKVCYEWHNFQNFAKWHNDNYVKGYCLDKDIKIPGNKLYSPDTCMFVSRQQNSADSNYRQFGTKPIQKGDVFTTNRYGDVIVLEYISSYKIKIKFINTGHIRYTNSSQLKNGSIRDKKVPFVKDRD